MNNKSYIIIMPVRNEAKFLEGTIDSIAMQTILPVQLVVVDDGSTDDTAKLANALSARYAWIQVLRRSDRGFRAPGSGVIEAFYDGFALIENNDWGFLVKLDGDLSFEKDYFERCLRRFDKDKKLGIGGGTICNNLNDALVVESPGDPRFHVRGATKIYKRECWDAIGGLIRQPGWDTVDEYHANMLGMKTYTFPEIRLCHHRPAGGAQGAWKNWVKNGLANYVTGYHPLFMLAKCLSRSVSKPYGIGAIGLFTGFIKGYVKRVPQVPNRELIRFVRGQQMRKLFLRESLWDQSPH